MVQKFNDGRWSRRIDVADFVYSNITPYNWMQEERSREIYKDLCETDLSINSIAEKFNFSGTGHLSEFCKRFLGNTPLKIRKEYRAKRAERRRN